jgi:hypothetical protein
MFQGRVTPSLQRPKRWDSCVIGRHTLQNHEKRRCSNKQITSKT